MFIRFFAILATLLPQPLLAQTEWQQWAVKVNAEQLFERLMINPETTKLLPFQPVQVQFSVLQTGNNLFKPSISIIAAEDMGPMISEVLTVTNSRLPDMGCRDFIAIEQVKTPATQDRRSGTNTIHYPFRIFGAERACDWPHGTYAKYSGPINLSLSLGREDKSLSISPSLDIGAIQINWRDYGKIGREIFRVADDAADFFGGDLGFEEAMQEIDNALNLGKYEQSAQSLLGKYAAEIDLEEIVPEEMVDSIAWSDDTGFFREVRQRSSCGFGVSGPIVSYSSTATYMLNIELELKDSISEPQARLFSSFAKSFIQDISTGPASFIQPTDIQIQPSFALKPSDCY